MLLSHHRVSLVVSPIGIIVSRVLLSHWVARLTRILRDALSSGGLDNELLGFLLDRLVHNHLLGAKLGLLISNNNDSLLSALATNGSDDGEDEESHEENDEKNSVGREHEPAVSSTAIITFALDISVARLTITEIIRIRIVVAVNPASLDVSNQSRYYRDTSQ